MQFEVPMKENISCYVCNHGSPRGERDTASPRLCAMLRTQASDEEVDDVFSRRPLYFGHSLSPANRLCFCMYASDTGHADGVPHSDP